MSLIVVVTVGFNVRVEERTGEREMGNTGCRIQWEA